MCRATTMTTGLTGDGEGDAVGEAVALTTAATSLPTVAVGGGTPLAFTSGAFCTTMPRFKFRWRARNDQHAARAVGAYNKTSHLPGDGIRHKEPHDEREGRGKEDSRSRRHF